MRVPFLTRAVTVLACGLLVVLFVVLLGQILLRTFARPLVWAEEFSTFAFIWLVFAGAALAYLRREHLEVDLFHEWASARLDGRVMRVWNAGAVALQIVFLAVLAVGLVMMARQSWALFAGSLPGFRFGWIYLGVLAAVVAAVAILAVRLRAALSGPARGGPRP